MPWRDSLAPYYVNLTDFVSQTLSCLRLGLADLSVVMLLLLLLLLLFLLLLLLLMLWSNYLEVVVDCLTSLNFSRCHSWPFHSFSPTFHAVCNVIFSIELSSAHTVKLQNNSSSRSTREECLIKARRGIPEQRAVEVNDIITSYRVTRMVKPGRRRLKRIANLKQLG